MTEENGLVAQVLSKTLTDKVIGNRLRVRTAHVSVRALIYSRSRRISKIGSLLTDFSALKAIFAQVLALKMLNKDKVD